MLKSRIDREVAKREELKDFEDRITECIDNPEDLNNWEEEFLESILIHVAGEGRLLTSSQSDTLEKIEYKVEWGMEAYWEEFGEYR